MTSPMQVCRRHGYLFVGLWQALTLLCAAQEHQASLAVDISTLQPQLADLVQHVIADSASAEIKAQRRADALSATCSVVEALQRLLPAAGQAGLDDRAASLAEAAAQQLASLGQAPGKVDAADSCHSTWSVALQHSCVAT